jgi:hypothetical protein
MTPATVAYHLLVNSSSPYGRYAQTDAHGVEDAARAMEALRGPGGEGDTSLRPGENPNPSLGPECVTNSVILASVCYII